MSNLCHGVCLDVLSRMSAKGSNPSYSPPALLVSLARVPLGSHGPFLKPSLSQLQGALKGTEGMSHSWLQSLSQGAPDREEGGTHTHGSILQACSLSTVWCRLEHFSKQAQAGYVQGVSRARDHIHRPDPTWPLPEASRFLMHWQRHNHISEFLQLSKDKCCSAFTPWRTDEIREQLNY